MVLRMLRFMPLTDLNSENYVKIGKALHFCWKGASVRAYTRVTLFRVRAVMKSL